MGTNTYSFADVSASYAGPGGTFAIGNGAGPSEEGISVSQVDDLGTMTIGADGSYMHSLHSGRAGTVTARFLKTSPVNALLMDALNTERQSGANYGDGTIVIRNPQRGDVISCSGCGWKKVPDLNSGKTGQIVEWVWNSGRIDQKIGTGTPSVI
ncbi:phage protein [Bosea sp. 2KB_26]|uniref:phage protein n=1 Tax=Bosea sp. 2KB_26 TaxID=3237475 RepID=UPI003F93A82F